MLEINKIYHSDCLDLLKEFPDKLVDLVLTDIPYGEVNRESNGLRNLEYNKADIVEFNLSDILKELLRICKGSIYIFCGNEQISEIRKTFVNNGLSTRLIIWEKTNPSPMNGKHIWLSGIETCVYGKFPSATFNGHCLNTVLRYPLEDNVYHDTQKSLKLFQKLVFISSNESDLILDPFSGSGTTAIAAYNLNRNFICIEKDKEYFDKSVQRLENHKLQGRMFS